VFIAGRQYYTHTRIVVGPILWGHSSPLCHALSLSLLSWTSMRRRRATVVACDSSDTWWMARSGEWAQHFFKCFLLWK